VPPTFGNGAAPFPNGFFFGIPRALLLLLTRPIAPQPIHWTLNPAPPPRSRHHTDPPQHLHRCASP